MSMYLLDTCKKVFQMFLLFIAFFLLQECQQAEVAEMETGKGPSSLAEFVNNLIDQMNDVKVGPTYR